MWDGGSISYICHTPNELILSFHFFIKTKNYKLSSFKKINKIYISQPLIVTQKKSYHREFAIRIKLSFYRFAILYTFDKLFFLNFRQEKSHVIRKNHI